MLQSKLIKMPAGINPADPKAPRVRNDQTLNFRRKQTVSGCKSLFHCVSAELLSDHTVQGVQSF